MILNIILLIIGVITFFMGADILSQSKGAIHEIAAFLLFLISTVLISSAFIVSYINSLIQEIKKQKDMPNYIKSVYANIIPLLEEQQKTNELLEQILNRFE